jgi:hypothetical protein
LAECPATIFKSGFHRSYFLTRVTTKPNYTIS